MQAAKVDSPISNNDSAALLREAELTDFVENAQLSLHWVDAKGIIKWANKTEMEFLGYSPEEYIGQPISKFHADEAVINDILCRLIKNEVLQNYEARLRCKDGSIRNVLISSSVYRNQGEFVHTRCFTTDITGRKKIETALLEQSRLSELRVAISGFLASSKPKAEVFQQCCQALVDGLDMAFVRIWSLNAATQTLELQASAGIYTHLDGAHARVKVGAYKIGRIAANKKPHLSNNVPEDPEVSDQAWAAREGMAAFAGYPLLLEDRLFGVIGMFSRNKLSDLILKDLSPLIFGITQWIQRKDSELELLTHREWLRVTMSSIGDGIVATSQDGLISYLNPVAESLTGWSSAEAINQPVENVFRIVHEQNRKPVENPIKIVLRDGVKVALANHTVLIAKDGREIPVEDSAAPIRDANGALIGAVMVFYDVTSRRQREQELEESSRREIQLRLEAEKARLDAERANLSKDQFFATLSHELRSPLTPMLGWAKLLLNGTLDEKAKHHGLVVMERNIKSQAKLIDDILDISRIISGKLALKIAPVNLVDVVNAAIDTVRPAADAKHIRLEFVADQNVVEISADADRLQQVVWNILANAIKFTPKQGAVKIHLRLSNSQAEMSITDTGAGLSPEFIPHLFERFSQADSSSSRVHGGLGIGLSLVKHLVEQHGGVVGAESPGLGLGSTFTVRIPIRALKGLSSTSEPEHSPKSATRETLKNVRIVVIDDDADAREMISLALGQSGANVVSASSVAAGLAEYQSHKPNVIICDLGMPHEDGFVFIRKLREIESNSKKTTPVIALTAFALDSDRHRCLNEGFQLHLAKPMDPFQLVIAVKKQLVAS